MAYSDGQVVLASSDAYADAAPLFHPDYLTASPKHQTQTLCGNPEGWGPLSPFRYDFTPW